MFLRIVSVLPKFSFGLPFLLVLAESEPSWELRAHPSLQHTQQLTAVYGGVIYGDVRKQ